MHIGRRALIVLISATTIVTCVGTASAQVPWGNASGSGTFFSWQNGQSANGLYGDPTLAGGNTFIFFPSAFRADASNGASDSISETLEVDLIAHMGYEFNGITVTELGDYGIFNDGSVSVTGDLTVTDLVNTRPNKVGAIVTSPPSPITSGSGNWTGNALVNMVGDSPAWTQIHVTLQNDLLAISVAGSSTYIEKKVLGQGIALKVIPEPASLSLLALGTLAMVRRKRA